MTPFKTVFLLLSVVGLQQSTAQISGTIGDAAKASWSLKNLSGVDVPIQLDSTGSFRIDIKKLKKGFYTLGPVGEVYLEPGFNLNVAQSAGMYTFTGKGAQENNMIQEINLPLRKLATKNGYGLPNTIFQTEPAQFLPVLDSYTQNAKTVLAKSKNVFFSRLVSQQLPFVKISKLSNYRLFYGMDSTKMDSLKKYLAIPVAARSKDHGEKTYQAYLAQFSKKLSDLEKEMLDSIMYKNWDMNNEVLFENSSAYQEAVKSRLNQSLSAPAMKPLRDSLKNNDLARLTVIDQSISSPKIKAQLIYTYTLAAIKKAKSQSEVQVVYDAALRRQLGAEHRAEISNAYQKLKAAETNAIAPDFSYVNTNNEQVTLTSLRGNYVYIDIWATWCAPCIAEIPDLKKIEEAFKNHKIKFVSLSIDTAPNKQKWLSFVKENELQGIQLIADKDWNSGFLKAFNVQSIPRCILLGPDGRIIDNDAKRPSNPKLKAQLSELLSVGK